MEEEASFSEEEDPMINFASETNMLRGKKVDSDYPEVKLLKKGF